MEGSGREELSAGRIVTAERCRGHQEGRSVLPSVSRPQQAMPRRVVMPQACPSALLTCTKG